MNKRPSRSFCVAACATLILSCGSDEAQFDPAIFSAAWWRPMVTQIVERLELTPGERVFAVGNPDLHAELPELFAAAVEAVGGTYVGTLSAAEGPYGPVRDAAFTERAWSATQAAPGVDRAEYRELLRDVPVGIMLPGPTPADPPYVAMQDLLWEQLGRHRTVHFHWAGAYTVEDLSYPIAHPPAQFQPTAIERLPCTGAPSSTRVFPIYVPATMRSRVRRAPARFTSQRLLARTFDFESESGLSTGKMVMYQVHVRLQAPFS